MKPELSEKRESHQAGSALTSSFHAYPNRSQVRMFLLVVLLLIIASFLTIELQWLQIFSFSSLTNMAHFLSEFVPPDTSPEFIKKVTVAAWETLAMSAVGTLLAVIAALALVLLLPARLSAVVLNALRSIPELVWAALLLISAGLGPFAGTLALALHTTGVLGRLFSELIEDVPEGPSQALKAQGVGGLKLFSYGILPEIFPQLMSYSLYRWENNIRAASVLGIVGAGGLGQLLHFHLGLFQMQKTASVILAMLVLVAAVDTLSYIWRSRLKA